MAIHMTARLGDARVCGKLNFDGIFSVQVLPA
jgi:hypothetical protein